MWNSLNPCYIENKDKTSVCMSVCLYDLIGRFSSLLIKSVLIKKSLSIHRSNKYFLLETKKNKIIN